MIKMVTSNKMPRTMRGKKYCICVNEVCLKKIIQGKFVDNDADFRLPENTSYFL